MKIICKRKKAERKRGARIRCNNVKRNTFGITQKPTERLQTAVNANLY